MAHQNFVLVQFFACSPFALSLANTLYQNKAMKMQTILAMLKKDINNIDGLVQD